MVELVENAPVHLSPTLRVMTLITPPMASEPYSVDMGPRMTSMRSMASIGGIHLVSMPWLMPPF